MSGLKLEQLRWHLMSDDVKIFVAFIDGVLETRVHFVKFIFGRVSFACVQ